MKKTLQLLAAMLIIGLSISSTAFSQGLVLVTPEQTPETVAGEPAEFELKSHPVIQNSSNADISFTLSVTPIKLTSGHLFALCDLFTCYPPKDSHFESPVNTLEAGAESGGAIYIYLYPSNTEGESELNVRFANTDNSEDAVSYRVIYNVGPIDVDETQVVAINIADVVPNPVNNSAVIKLNSLSGETLIITDMTGNRISEKTLSSDLEETEINTSELANGTYFYSVLSKGTTVQTGRFVVSH